MSLPILHLSGLATETAGTEKTTPETLGNASPALRLRASSGLDALEQTLFTKPTTSLIVVKAGKIVYSYGEISHVSYLASARKSVLSMLYGNYVAKGVFDL